jgi:site-specific DNA recombinase
VIAIYCRVSTEEQSTKGYSIGSQIDQCIAKAGTSDVLRYIDEGYTGEILNRPYLTKLREDVQNGLVHKIVCYDPDRLSRNLLIQLLLDDEFKKNQVELVFVRGEYQDNPEGKMFFSMRGAISEFEKAKIKERTWGGKIGKAKKGFVVKNSHLFGYDYNKDKKTYTINEKESEIIRLIFNYYTDPNSPFKGINGIANHLTDIKIETKNGAKAWHRQVVRQILMNEAYKGIYIQNKWDTFGNYVRKQSGEKQVYKIRPEEEWIIAQIPPIITEEQFDYAQKLLGQGRRRYTNYGKHNYLLSGLVRCGRCGCTMTGKKKKSHGKDFYVYECRKNYAGAKTKGCGKEMSENKLNTFVWENLIDIFNNPDKIKEFKEDVTPNYVEDELKHLEAEIEKTKKGRKRLFQLVSLDEDNELDLEEIKNQIRDLQVKEKELTTKYNQLTEEIKEEQETESSQYALQSAIDLYVLKKEKELSIEEKQTILRMAVKEVIIIDSETVHIQLF